MRLIYDQRRRDTNPFFLLTALAWGGLIAASGVGLSETLLESEPRLVPLLFSHEWIAAWRLGGTLGGIFLVVGFCQWAVAVRIAADESGLQFLSTWGRQQWLFRWADVQSWRFESYQKHVYEAASHLVIELKSSKNPLIVTDDWQVAVAAELRANAPAKFRPIRTAASSELGTPPDLTLIHPLTHSDFRWEKCSEKGRRGKGRRGHPGTPGPGTPGPSRVKGRRGGTPGPSRVT